MANAAMLPQTTQQNTNVGSFHNPRQLMATSERAWCEQRQNGQNGRFAHRHAQELPADNPGTR